MKPHIVIISPALAKANNGNWQTASRWIRFLRPHYRVECRSDWKAASADTSPSDAPDLMIALHARRSAEAITSFATQFPQRPLIVVLTGTDLYRDIRTDLAARRSLELASHLVVLQARGLDELSPVLRQKALVIHQSAPSMKPHVQAANARHFNVIMVGHLRIEKQPATFMHAASLLRTKKVRLLHVGAALEPELGIMAEMVSAAVPRYWWLGALPHARTRQRLRRSQLMVLCSSMEGGANVIIEAIRCGVPVLASDIPGNRGMLGEDYAGYFPVGDSATLASMIDRAATDLHFHAALCVQCAARATLFAPLVENAAVVELADNCIIASLAHEIRTNNT